VSGSTETTTTAPAATISQGEALVDGVPGITLTGPASRDAGAYPLFMWEPATGAFSYQLVVIDSVGPIWAWQGETTEVRLGGVDGEPPADYGGPALTEASCWSVVALDAQDHTIAASDLVPVAPGNEPTPTCSPGG
jgi:hypothetical protein